MYEWCPTLLQHHFHPPFPHSMHITLAITIFAYPRLESPPISTLNHSMTPNTQATVCASNQMY